MENSHNPRPVSRSTIGEVLIVALVVVGFFVAILQNKVTLQDISLVGFLALIVIFYMALLFCRMLFFWMTGGDRPHYPWWKNVEMMKKYEQKSK